MIKKILLILILLGIAVPCFAYDITWQNTNGLYTGFIRQLKVASWEPELVIAGAGAKGVNISYNRAGTWEFKSSYTWSGAWGTLSQVTAIGVDHNGTGVIYAGGITSRYFKASADQGNTWYDVSSLPSTIEFSGTDTSANIVVDPNNSSKIYMHTGDKVYKINLDNPSPTWEEITSNLPTESGFVLMFIEPNKSNIFINAYSNSTGWRSTNEGQSWTSSSGYICGSPMDGSRIYKTNHHGLLKVSTNEGDSWTNLNISPFSVTDTIYKKNMAVYHKDANIIYVILNSQVRFSSDGGQSFSPAYFGLPEYFLNPIIDIIVSTDNSHEAYVTCFGDGVYKTTNAGQSWTRASDRFTNTWVSDISINPENNYVYAATNTIITERADGVWRSINGGESWNKLPVYSTPFLSEVEVDKSNKGHVYVGGSYSLNSGVTYAGGMLKSLDHGESWVAINQGLPNLFISDIIIDYMPSTSRVYVSTIGQGVFWGQTGPSGVSSWNKLPSQGLETFDIVSLALDLTVEGHSIYAGSKGGGVYKFDLTGGISWEVLDSAVAAGDIPNAREVSEMIVDTSDNNIIYAGTDLGLYVSMDGGSSWTERRSGVMIHSLFLDSWTDPHTVYVGTGNVLYRGDVDVSYGGLTNLNYPLATSITEIARDESNFNFYLGGLRKYIGKGIPAVGFPETPTNLEGTVISETQINWTWTDNSTTEFGYKFNKLAPIIGEINLPEDDEDYSEINLLPNTIYTREVVAYNTFESIASDSSWECTWAYAPSNLRATSWEGDQILLNWDYGSNPSYTKYVIEMSETTTGAFTPDSTQEVSLPPPYYFDFLVPRNDYRFRVMAENLFGIETGFTNLITEETIHETLGPEISDIRFDGRYLIEDDIVMPDPIITAKIRDLATTPESPTGISKETITLIFADYYQVDGYQIDSLISAGSYYDMTHEIKVPLGAGEHTFYIEAYDELGNRGTSIPTTINVMAGTVNMIGETIAYPAPYSPKLGGDAVFTYSLSTDAPITIYLFDISGQIMWTKKYSTGTNGARAGYNEVRWDGRTDFGGTIGNGIFIYQILSKGKKIGSGKLIVYD